jgi:hypothetical protein
MFATALIPETRFVSSYYSICYVLSCPDHLSPNFQTEMRAIDLSYCFTSGAAVVITPVYSLFCSAVIWDRRAEERWNADSR